MVVSNAVSGAVVTVATTIPGASRLGPTNGQWTLTRTGSTAAALTVSYNLGGTAVNGVDYNTLATSITIPAGAASATLSVTPKPATNYVGSEAVTLSLTGSAAYTVGSPGSATSSFLAAILTASVCAWTFETSRWKKR